jgi:Tol biopolymer transport system component
VYVGELQAGATRLEEVRRVTLDDRDDHLSGWTRDSAAVYFSSTRHGSSDIFRQGVRDRTADVVVEGPGREDNAQLSPDGSYLLYMTYPLESDSALGRVMRVPVGGGPPELVLEQKDIAGFDCPSVAGEACVLVAHESGKTAFYALDPLKGKGRKIGENPTLYAIWSVSRDGTRMAFGDGEMSGAAGITGIRIMRVSDGTKLDFHTEGLKFPSDAAWAADGKGLFIVDRTSVDYRLLHIDLDGHVSVLHRSPFGVARINVSYASPDGRYLAFEKLTRESNAWLLENF